MFAGISGVGMLLATVMLGTYFYITRPSACLNETSSISVEICHPNLSPLAITSFVLMYVAFAIGWGPVPWILVGESTPLRVRGLGSSLGSFVLWGTSILVSSLYLMYSDLVHLWFTWWTFSIFNFLGIFFVLFFVKETKGKALEDISRVI